MSSPSTTTRDRKRSHIATPTLAVLAERLRDVAQAEARAGRTGNADRWRRFAERYEVELAVRGVPVDAMRPSFSSSPFVPLLVVSP